MPSDRVKDAPALARELRWRARAASGYNSEDEEDERRPSNGHSKVNEISESVQGTVNGNGHGKKRKRSEDASLVAEARFRNFLPKTWEGTTDKGVESTSRKIKALIPEPLLARDSKSEGWKDEWLEWRDEPLAVEDGKEGQDVEVSRKRFVSAKVRRTTNGVERQRIERVVEKWSWTNNPARLVNGDSTTALSVEPRTKDEVMADS